MGEAHGNEDDDDDEPATREGGTICQMDSDFYACPVDRCSRFLYSVRKAITKLTDPPEDPGDEPCPPPLSDVGEDPESGDDDPCPEEDEDPDGGGMFDIPSSCELLGTDSGNTADPPDPGPGNDTGTAPATEDPEGIESVSRRGALDAGSPGAGLAALLAQLDAAG